MSSNFWSTASLKVDPKIFIKKINHIFHTGESMVHGPSHLNFWLDYFAYAIDSTLILVRNLDLYNWIKENYPQFSVAFAKNVGDIDCLFNNLYFIKSVYYSSNTGNTLHTLKFNELTHIFIGHGDSDKAASAHKYFRVYDEIWVAGQAHIDRFKNAGFPIEKMSFTKVGRPSLRNILSISNITWFDRMDNSFLYLPTWEGVYEESNYASLHLSSSIIQVIDSLFPKSKISVKLHPVTGSRDVRFKDLLENLKSHYSVMNNNVNIYDKIKPIDELIINSNIFICDISAVVSECLAANGPIFVYLPTDKEIVISQSDMQYQDYCYIFSSMDELYSLLERVIIKKDDYLSKARVKAMHYILSKKETESEAFEYELSKTSESPCVPSQLSVIRQ